ncbi:MAG: DUF4139 domain-containing protein [Cytophagaceae bacterium]
MNRLSFTIVIIFLTCFQLMANPEKRIKSQIQGVTVYTNRAQVSNIASLIVDPGTTEVIVEGLPSGIHKNTLSVIGKGDFTIMAVKFQADHLNQQKSKELLDLEQSLEALQDKLTEYNIIKQVLNKEESLWLANLSIGGTERPLDPDDVDDMADSFRVRLSDIYTKLAKNEKQIKALNEKIAALNQQIKDLSGYARRSGGRVHITVSSKIKTTAQFDIEYLVNDAGWYPVYDIRANDTKSPVNLQYKAQVYQNTGQNWEKVKIKLSTANPSLSGTKPNLQPWWVDFYEPMPMKKSKYEANMDDREQRSAFALSEAKPLEMVVTENLLAVEFEIATPYTIPSDPAGQLIDVQTYQLPATYTNYLIPKLDPDVFLIASVTGWDNLNMLSGNANVYFEGAYVGESYINMKQLTDTLQISLGRNKNVIAERKDIKDYSSKGFIGNNKKDEHAFEIKVRNTRKEPIKLIIEDQIPLSRNSQIEVSLLEAPGSVLDKETGKVVWKVNLGATETKSFTLKYQVKYPKNKQVTGGFW